ncbi:glycosyltransferase family 4 protein [Lichenicoccus sp.]|uniref:glycosyltransferase family 4 protein n=1 Tax=Lichenicoccus sp. TaxID=2781899 RepID=UPI003D109885
MDSKIWVDVEDLFQYAAANPRPSGIQRIEFELCRALATLPESRERVRFVRHAATLQSFTSIPYAQVERLHDRLTSSSHAGAPSSRAGARTQPARTLSQSPWRRLAYRLPEGLRKPLVALFKAEREAGRAVLHLGSALAWAGGTRAALLVRQLRQRRSGEPAPGQAGHPAERGRSRGAVEIAPFGPGMPPGTMPSAAGGGADTAAFDATTEPGDILLVLGSPWFHPYYAEIVAKAQRTRGLRFSLLIYDIIPLRRPEWCDHNLVLRFREWTGAIFPLVDVLLTISQASARDLESDSRRAGYSLRSTPRPIPIGTGFSDAVRAPAGAGRTGKNPQASARSLPGPGSYALIVSTIEARKNHMLLFRVWRRMVEEMPLDRIPTLVFAGRVGWLVSDLMQQIHNADYLDGKIVLVEDPSDDELRQLYAGCRFTLFPSFYEGWGLPVTESLSFGRPCIISNATSLPEAGGDLARYFDPENSHEAYDMIRHAIEHPEETEAWAERVQREFRPVSWEDSARGVLHALEPGLAAEPALSLASESTPARAARTKRASARRA